MPILALFAFGVSLGAAAAGEKFIAIAALVAALIASVIVINRKG